MTTGTGVVVNGEEHTRLTADQAARAAGFADAAEQAACQHSIDKRLVGDNVRPVGLVVIGPGGRVEGIHDYRKGVRTRADVERVRDLAERQCERLTKRAVKWYRTTRRAAP